MDANVTLNKVRTILGLEVILEEKLLENGTKFVAEKFEGGNEVFIQAEDDQKIPVPAGEYEMEDGQTLVVKEDGLIDEIRDAEETEEEDEEMGYDDKEEMRDDGEEAAVDDWEGMEKRIKNLEDAIADLKEKVGGEQKEIEEDLSADVKEEVELSAEPKEIKHNPEAKNQVELTKIGKVSNLRQRVFNKIFDQ
tara:strand:- start:9305 stop:9883 length:579 start_codon:yes stop_codon:yes gene_type:complete